MIILVFMTFLIVLLSAIVPIFQYLKANHTKRTKKRYYFDESLFNYDTDDLYFENTTIFQNIKNNRSLITMRGSIRQANGEVHDFASFEDKKKEIYNIKLP